MTVMCPYHYSSYAYRKLQRFVVCARPNVYAVALKRIMLRKYSFQQFSRLQVMQDWLSISKILNRLCALRALCVSFKAVTIP